MKAQASIVLSGCKELNVDVLDCGEVWVEVYRDGCYDTGFMLTESARRELVEVLNAAERSA